jgi:hypothetical protein
MRAWFDERAREAFESGLDGRNGGKLVLNVGNGSAVSAGGAMIRAALSFCSRT